jgi:pimeloyl-ACP methyl ester carboxylesterase
MSARASSLETSATCSLGLVAATAPRSFTARVGLQSVGRRASPGPRGRMRRRLSSLAGPALRGALAARRPGDAPRVVISLRSRSVASGSDASARDDDVPPLAYEMVEPPPGTPGASDAPIALVLHGLLGSGRNWRTFTRALSRACAEAGAPWRFALCDLIYHGKTHAERAHRASRNPALRADARDDDDAPDPLDLAADAVDRLAAHLRRRRTAPSSDADADADAASASATESDSRPPPPVAAVLGHSLGGKVALRYLHRAHAAGTLECALGGGGGGPHHPAVRSPSSGPLEVSPDPPPRRWLAQWWTLDSAPCGIRAGSDPHGVSVVLDAVAALPRRFASREELGERLERSGRTFSRELVDWLGTNLAPTESKSGGGAGVVSTSLGWTFDVDGAKALYAAYARDGSRSMATTVAPPGGTEVHVVRAARSARWPAETVGAIEAAAKERGARVRMYRLEDAGHWLHADNPEGLRDIVAPRLVELARAIREGEERHR